MSASASPRDQDPQLTVGLDIVDFSEGVSSRRLPAAVDDIAIAEDQGFATAWIPLLGGGPDPLAVCAAASSRTRRIRLATGVLRTWGHHPVELARAAASVATLCEGRLVLGVGVSHRPIVEAVYGQSFSRPAAHLREYLAILAGLLRQGEVDFRGEVFSAQATLDLTGVPPVAIAAAAGGPQMLAAAAELSDMVVTNMVGPRSLASHTVPVVRQAADRAGRRPPRLAAAVTVCVTEDRRGAALFVDETLQAYARNPDYRAMLDREGVGRPSDIAIIGDERSVRTKLESLREVGADEIIASIKAPHPTDEDRTRRFLGSLGGA